jgi:DNA-binding transcriptional MerR regulator
MGGSNMETKTFSISEVSKMTRVSKNRIREWYEKGLLPEVQMISVGIRLHRRFTLADTELIKRISENLGQGYVLEVAAEKAREK